MYLNSIPCNDKMRSPRAAAQPEQLDNRLQIRDARQSQMLGLYRPNKRPFARRAEAIFLNESIKLEGLFQSPARSSQLSHKSGRQRHTLLNSLYHHLRHPANGGSVFVEFGEQLIQLPRHFILPGRVVRQLTAVNVHNVLRRPQTADLSRVEGRAAGPLDAVCRGHLADYKRPRYVGLPPLVHCEAAVVVLGANRNLQRLGTQIDTILFVYLDGGRIHGKEPFNRGILERAGPFEVLICLRLKGLDVERLGRRLHTSHLGLPAEVWQLIPWGWGWLLRCWSLAIPKPRLRLPPGMAHVPLVPLGTASAGTPSGGIVQKVQENAPAFLHLVEHQQIDQ